MANEEATREQSEEIVSEQGAQEQTESGETGGATAAAAESNVAEGSEQAEGATMDIETLKQSLVALQATVDEQKEGVLRAQAEMQNVRRRAERDVENAHKYALDKFSADLLPIIDSLERALEAADSIEGDAGQAMKDGVELTLKMFVDTLAKHGIEQLDPMGEPFNPEFHQAMSMVPNPEMEPNSVMAVMQKGYRLHGRLVRPAMVVVTKSA